MASSDTYDRLIAVQTQRGAIAQRRREIDQARMDQENDFYRQQWAANNRQQVKGEIDRQAAADRFAYESALMGQQQEFQAAYAADREAARFQNELELFQRHEAGRMAELQLQQLEQQRMAEFQAGQQEARDYRLGDIEAGRLAQQQDFTGQMAEFEAGVQEARDYRLNEFEQQRLGQQQGFQAGMAGFEAGVQQDRDTARMTHEATLADMAQRGREAMEEILNRNKQGLLDQEYLWRVNVLEEQQQQEQDEFIFKGLASGELELSPEALQRLENNANARTRILGSPDLSEEDKSQALAQIDEDNIRTRRGATRPGPEKRAASLESARQGAINRLPPQFRAKPWQFDPKSGMLQLPRGWKEPEEQEQGPMGQEQLQHHLRATTVTMPNGTRLQWVPGKAGGTGEWKEIGKSAQGKEPDYVDQETKLRTYIEKRVQDYASQPLPPERQSWYKSTAMPNSEDIQEFRAKLEEEVGLTDLVRRRQESTRERPTGSAPAGLGQQQSPADSKIAAAIQAARNGDVAAQRALERRGIQWQ